MQAACHALENATTQHRPDMVIALGQ
ncbi:hypothetical protein, partial [Kingella kingae]